MPGKKKKPFIDKKNAVTFHLVHRSQKDPLQADEDAPERVLMPANEKHKQEEQQKYGIFFDDGYDYMQHLKEANEAYELEAVGPYNPYLSMEDDFEQNYYGTEANEGEENDRKVKIQLPSSVFASEVETDTGMLNKAETVIGPRPDLDPDILAALDDDYDFDNPDNILEDDFVTQANTATDSDDIYWKGDDDEEEYSGSDIGSDEQLSDVGSLENFETKSHFTNYSMTSSVIRRNEGLTLLDDRFEQLYTAYGDDEIGALDNEDIEGRLQQGSEVLNDILDEFEKQQAQVKLKDVIEKGKDNVEIETDSEEDDGDDDLVKMVMEKPDEKWDCETILSTYSTLYNHPKTIEEPTKKEKDIKFSKKTGIPLGILPQKGLTKKQLEKEMDHANKGDVACTYRPKDESTDEKRARKKAVKEQRKERRAEKKANKVAFKAEQIRQEKELINLQNNLQGVKIV
ncbi:protein LTV1 homolog isoform X2 [Lingula anatina]|uniref:Protein LTV1 homolog n=1 Tax=Lingula anatina TaxID=7574 RepID=A0A1S3KH48_LINAN|nr:protein LTV1 homolog isoform X1 [Lingula anatina]XP_013421818.1 protein LTV1 homolog isoform X2 [Lingula anatina]|eukprot:XP_013421817.1 protein LTV1 homolog isoform X1 [Lingula anatina]